MNKFLIFFIDWINRKQEYKIIEMFVDGSQREVIYKGNKITYGKRVKKNDT